MQSSFAQTLWRRRQLGEIKIVEKVEAEDRVQPGMLNITIQVLHFVKSLSGTLYWRHSNLSRHTWTRSRNSDALRLALTKAV